MKRIPLFLMLAVPALAGAQTPAGADFRVNTYTTGIQSYPRVATEPDGDFLVVWTSQQGDAGGAFGARFDATAAERGGEFQVNTTEAGGQYAGGVAVRSHGDFVAVWGDSLLDGSGYGIFAQRYDASGVGVGGEFQVNTYTTDSQWPYAVAMAADGRFVVVWTSYAEDGSAYGVFARRYDAFGNALGGAFRVNTYTTNYQQNPVAAMAPDGRFVVVWESQDGNSFGLYGQLFDAAGGAVGGEFRVNTFTTGYQREGSVAMVRDGSFVVVWDSLGQDGSGRGVFGQRFSATGSAVGPEFPVNATTPGDQQDPSLAADARGNFVVTWTEVGLDAHVAGRRFFADGTPRGTDFVVNAATGLHAEPSIGSDAVGNFVVAWNANFFPAGDISGRRFGGIVPHALAVDADSGGNLNQVLEAGEAVDVTPTWRNINGDSQTFNAGVPSMGFTGPGSPSLYEIHDGTGTYGTVNDGATDQCESVCYHVGLGVPGTRPARHWDAELEERLTPDTHGQTKLWKLHVGESFDDVPQSSGFYRQIETLLHNGVTSGCALSGDRLSYCPTQSTTREQMSKFVLLAKEGGDYAPPPCDPADPRTFADVPAGNGFCPFIEELFRRGVVNGCALGPLRYCPQGTVTREQMAKFVLLTLDPTLVPPPCTSGSEVFADVPASSGFCPYIEELFNRQVVNGCATNPPRYCPTNPVTREQMSKFLGLTFELTLFGP